MSQPPSQPPGSTPRNQASSSLVQLNDDFADFEGDPTSINQVPTPGPIVVRPANMHPPHPPPSAQPPANQFASASPSLSHVGPPVAQYAASSGLGHAHAGHAAPSNQPAPPAQAPAPMPPMMQPIQMIFGMAGMTMTAMPGSQLAQVSGVIAPPTPYVSRSRLY